MTKGWILEQLVVRRDHVCDVCNKRRNRYAYRQAIRRARAEKGEAK